MFKDSTIDLLEQLLSGWSFWEDYETYYLKELLPRLKNNPESGSEKEKNIIINIKDVALKEEWDNLEEIAKSLYENKKKSKELRNKFNKYLEENNFTQARKFWGANRGFLSTCKYKESIESLVKPAQEDIEVHLNNYEFCKADEEFNKIKDILAEDQVSDYQEKRAKSWDLYNEEQLTELNSALSEYNYQEAQRIYESAHDAISKKMYDDVVAKYKEKQRKEKIITQTKQKFEYLLGKYDFPEADKFFQETGFFKKDEYEKLKSGYIKKYIKGRLKIDIDDEKALAIADISKNTLVKARAGSGKTTVLACKTVLLIDIYKVDPNKIMILAFNTKAAKEIGDRIRLKYGFSGFRNARTFHSLAYQLVKPSKTLLFDDRGDPSVKKQSLFIQNTLRSIWNSIFRIKIYTMFKEELEEMETSGALLDSKMYFVYRRNLSEITLRGEKVKSTGEKYIADFLFEHSIPYKYEQNVYWKNENYRPDFSIFYKEKKFILEHWGVDENSPSSTVPKHWTMTYGEYIHQINKKRRYWKEKDTPLLETSVADLCSSREAFESRLKAKLESHGIACNKLADEEIQNKVTRLQIERMVQLFVQFIQKAKRKVITTERIHDKIKEFKAKDLRTQIFLELSAKMYLEYQRKLDTENAMDFDDLLYEAAYLVDSNRGNCKIRIEDSHTGMNELEYILIDEYQDFSGLFFELIKQILKYNKNVKLFCVGDDWQAINSFAGSDLGYFNDFIKVYDSAVTKNLLINYRSKSKIVENANNFIKDSEEKQKWLDGNAGGNVFVEYIEDVKIVCKRGEYGKIGRHYDNKFIFYKQANDNKKVDDDGFIKAKCLKKCYQIIKNNFNAIAIDSGDKNHKGVAILSRTNMVYGVELKIFLMRLKSCFTYKDRENMPNIDSAITISTMHGFKGLEADIVILLNICEGAVPLIHPDNSLFKFFERDEIHVLEEEMRLFYVAITRPKESLWIITEKERISDFIKNIPVLSKCRFEN